MKKLIRKLIIWLVKKLDKNKDGLITIVIDMSKKKIISIE
jgi:hypothetical protein